MAKDHGSARHGELRGGLSREALAVPGVRRIVIAFGALTLGEWVLGTAVAISAYGLGGPLAVGLVGFRFVPAALAGLGTALLGERYRREKVLVVIALGRAAAGGGAAIALAAGSPFGVVVVLVWLDAAIGSGYRPAQAALLPALVRTPGQLTAAAALTSNAKSAGQAFGAVAGAHVIRGGEEIHMTSHGERIDAYMLVADSDRALVPMIWVYEPGASMGEAHAQPVDHFSYVIEGTVVVEIDDERYELTAGDTVYVRAGRRFRVRNENERVARLLGCGPHVPPRPASR